MILILFGPAATGKSTIGTLLAARLCCPFLDADDVHPAANIEKMSRGEPLTDADRWPWLDRIRASIVEADSRRECLVVACSALKRVYRQKLDPEGKSVRWVYLKGSRAMLDAISVDARLDEVPRLAQAIVAGQVRGRVVIDVNA